MGKVILDLAVTLDGYISGPNGEIDWLIKDEEADFGDILSEILIDIDAIFYGRLSYDLWGNYQPNEQASSKLKKAYKLMHRKTKYVFSRTKKSDKSNAIFINSDIKENVMGIKENHTGNIWLYGGGKLITTLINLNLVDIYRLAVHPVILGEGKPLFNKKKKKIDLKLTDTKKSNSGVILLTYSFENDK